MYGGCVHVVDDSHFSAQLLILIEKKEDQVYEESSHYLRLD